MVGQQQLQRLLTVAGNDGVVPLGFEVEAQSLGEVLLVFDDQDPAHVSWRGAAVRG